MSFYSPIICDVSRGQVRPGRQGRPRIYYWLQNEDFELLLRGVEQINRVFLAAGAQEVHATLRHWRPVRDHDDLAANLARRHRPLEMDISAYHPLGTCHMGGSRNSSVCDPNGETWDLRNLFIADGSTIPPALGVNPQITIAAVATRTADFINDRLSQL
jgi:choline dehydrogenase-like flavoprotein